MEESIKMPDMSRVLTSSSPHIHKGQNCQWIMGMVILALLPAIIASVIFFGLESIEVLLICTASCVLVEMAWHRLCGHPIPIKDLSAVLTGLLLGMNMPASIPWWVCVIASFFAIIFGKAVFGGLGHNPFNPALVGRVAVFLGFAGLMTTWVPTRLMPMKEILTHATSQATPLSKLGAIGDWTPQVLHLNNGDVLSYWDLFIGNVGGSLGETSALALLLGGILLIALKIIRWQMPVCFILTVFLLTQGLHYYNPTHFAPGLFHILTGGLFLGAIFMATDMVTTPARLSGNIIFAIGCGIITVVIRVFCNYPEGVSFAILFMNAFVPLINRFTGTPKIFGEK